MSTLGDRAAGGDKDGDGDAMGGGGTMEDGTATGVGEVTGVGGATSGDGVTRGDAAARDGGATRADEARRDGGAEGDPGVSDSPAGRLQSLFEGHRLTPTQRRIAHSMVRSAADVPFLSSVELAELAGVSQPSVTRFAVALGFDGYPALRRHLREVAPAEPAADTASYNEYQQAVEAEIENLRHLAAVLSDPRPVARAGRLLAASRPLPVLGLRAAASQAYGFAYFAAKVHPDVRLLHEGGTMLQDRIDAAVRAGATALLCFALPRHPREVLDALGHAKEAGLTVVTVADSAFAPVAKVSDLLLPAAVGTGLAFDTACAPMLLGRVLLEAMCDDLPDAQARLEQFDARAAVRGLFVE
ncbi:MurR/RpiR family transcriptional regulator [Streptomyces sp. NPDC096324]|uniref:MurR/RpiR family transcriptional regulator n=1 Tax=Streptomyces sp. NPDC096324 TaxID=3366085 RepID=UPI0038211BF4